MILYYSVAIPQTLQEQKEQESAITVNGNAAASTFSPGLIRDFTFGTEFRGVTTFDTQGYFVPPSGTTEQRGRGRGLFGGGDNPSTTNSIDYVNINSTGNAQDFGDLIEARDMGVAGSSTRGLFGRWRSFFKHHSICNPCNNRQCT